MNNSDSRPQNQPEARLLRNTTPVLVLILGCGGFIALGILGLLVLALMGPHRERIEDATVLRMKLSGELLEYIPMPHVNEFFGTPVLTVKDHLDNLQKAAADKRIKGVFIEMKPLVTGFAKIEELRDALIDFKKSGKFVIVYAEHLTEKEYALALAADEIIMPPDSWFEFNGLALDISHYPGLLEKVGIEVQYFRHGKYKSVAGEQIGRTYFTEPVKEMLKENLSVVFKHLVDAVAEARKLSRYEVEALIDEAGMKSDWAYEHKLIDQLAYFDEVELNLRNKLGLDESDERVPFVSAANYHDVKQSKGGKHTFALIYSVGIIVSGKSEIFGGRGTQGSTTIIRALRKAAEDDNVKAIILRVDSPGGAGLGCDYVRREIERIREVKPIIVSMSDVAASGGYWISMDATGIVAQPSTATGSIGVFGVVPHMSELYEKLGLNNETFKQGAHADVYLGARKMTEDEARRHSDDLKRTYERFVALAARARKMALARMHDVAQGRTWYGSQAVQKGLVDKLGGFDVAIAMGKEKAGLPLEATVKLVPFNLRRSLFEELTKRGSDDGVASQLGRILMKQFFGRIQKVPFFPAYAATVLQGDHHIFPMMEFAASYR